MKNHEVCYSCGYCGSTKAHVRDRNDCENNGIKNHEYLNVIPLCANCHYAYFDEGRMGIIEMFTNFYFVMLEKNGEIRLVKSLQTLNVLPEYIKWKNRRCKPQLHMVLFHPGTQQDWLKKTLVFPVC